MRKIFPLLIAFAILIGCNLPGLAVQNPNPTQNIKTTPQVSPQLPQEVTPRQVIPPSATLHPTIIQTDQPLPTSEPTSTVIIPGIPPPPEEAILILEPGPGSRVTSPVHIAGIADPTFEQTLGVSLILDDGQILAYGPVPIDAEVGQRGPFSVEVPFEVESEAQGFIQIFDSSPRDGDIVHLSSIGVVLLPSGEDAQIHKVDPYPERIDIYFPLPNQAISGGVVHVEGFALASFEQTLLVELLDAEGNVLAGQPVIVVAPDVGQPGRFQVDLVYSVNSEGPGRVVIRDISPAFGGDFHVASVEVTLAP